jgi:ATP-dependent Clp protease ATP-binding subunit ClpC
MSSAITVASCPCTPARSACTIQREIEDPLSEKILFGELAAGQIVVVDAVPEDVMKKDGPKKFAFRGEPKPSALALDEPPAGISAE